MNWTNWRAYVRTMKGGRCVLACGVGLVAVAGCGGKAAAPLAKPPIVTANANGNHVLMNLIAYQPEMLQVGAGTAVTWVQHDAGFHTVTSGTAEVEASGNILTHPDGAFRSEQLAQGQQYSFTFNQPGTYRYFCEVHPATMRGQITVR